LKFLPAALSWPIVSEQRPTVHVLIVDPDPVARSACRKLIASRGLTVAEAASTELALRWLEKVGPRLLVLDHGLGIELLKLIVSTYPKLEVVALCTGPYRMRLMDELKGMGLGAYVKDVWAKPLDPARVSAVLASVFPPAP
jgi:CheY-like chemotaxis protein